MIQYEFTHKRAECLETTAKFLLGLGTPPKIDWVYPNAFRVAISPDIEKVPYAKEQIVRNGLRFGAKVAVL